MKKKFLTALMIGAITIGVVPGMELPFTNKLVTTAYALDIGTKTANLNNAQVVFANGKTTTVQCYNIDGYNYVRARDITNGLGFEVQALQNGETGIMIMPSTAPSVSTAMEKLTIPSSAVKVQKGMIYYDSTGYEADCFLFKDRYYFKLADFASASQNSLNGKVEMTKIQASSNIAKEAMKKEFVGLGVNWNEETRTINVTKEIVNLQKVFEEVRSGKGVDVVGATTVNGTVGTNITKPVEEKPAEEPVKDSNEFKGTGVLTSAPQVGEVLADILIDDSKGAYKDNAMTEINYDNLQLVYSASHLGGCNWYVAGRFAETHGITSYKDLFKSPYATTKDWVSASMTDDYVAYGNIDGITNPKDIEGGCIAVWENHVAFVEFVERDANGNPTKVYFTEANAGHEKENLKTGVYYADYDCKVDVLDFEKFVSGRSSKFVGYVVAK